MPTRQEQLEWLKEQHAAIVAAIQQYQKDLEQLSRNGVYLEGQIELLERIIAEEADGRN